MKLCPGGVLVSCVTYGILRVFLSVLFVVAVEDAVKRRIILMTASHQKCELTSASYTAAVCSTAETAGASTANRKDSIDPKSQPAVSKFCHDHPGYNSRVSSSSMYAEKRFVRIIHHAGFFRPREPRHESIRTLITLLYVRP